MNHRAFLYTYGIFSLFAGMFISAFDIQVHSLFFAFFGYKYLATAYIAGGIAGMSIIYFFTLVYKRTGAKSLTFISITAITAFCGIFYILYLSGAGQWNYYYGMVVLFPVNTLLLITVWRYPRKLLLPVYARQILPVALVMFMAGMAISGAGITVGLYFLTFRQLMLCALICLVLLWLSVPLLNLVYNRNILFAKPKEKYIPVRHNFFLFFSSQYTRYLFLFSFLSAIIGFSIHFAFINLAWFEFRNIFGMSKFYGLYIAVSVVFVYGIDKFLIKRILYSYDSPYSLIVVAPLLGLSVLLTFLASSLIGGKLSGEHFTVFFLLVTISKVGYFTVNYTIQAPSLRTLYYSLDMRYRQVAYPRVEGSMVMAGLTTAGFVFLGLSFLRFFSVSIVLIFAGILCILFLFVSVKLIKKYKQALHDELSKLRMHNTDNENTYTFNGLLQKVYSLPGTAKIIEAQKISAQTRPYEFESDLKRLLSHREWSVRKIAIEYIAGERVVNLLSELKTKLPIVRGEEKVEVEKAIQKLDNIISLKISDNIVHERVNSGSIDERVDLALALAFSDYKDKEIVLLTLLKDFEPAVQNAAIKALAYSGSGNYCYTLIDYLYPGRFSLHAFGAIALAKEKALANLEHESLLSGTDDIVMERILKLYGKIGTPRAVDLLLSRLGEINSHILINSIQALAENRYQAGADNKLKIISHIVRLVGTITHNLNIIHTLQGKPKFGLLYDAYQRENRINYHQLFRLLSIIYNPNIIGSFEKLFLWGNRQEINHAVEMADTYFDSDLKPIIFPLLEDISIKEKLKRLDYYFPQSKLSVYEILADTITFDFNALTIYPRACSLILIDHLKLKGFDDELVFSANHPEKLLNETARYVLAKRGNFDALSGVSIPEFNDLLFVRFYRLIECPPFEKILSEKVLCEMAASMVVMPLKAGQALQTAELLNKISLIYIGTNTFSDGYKAYKSSNQMAYLPLLHTMGIKEFKFDSDVELYAFSRQHVSELINDNADLAGFVLSAIYNLQTIERDEQ
ncbi:MAG: hypothetical protein JXB34_14665 [Bacteroidales bacterium]|nr:hypothetical protein [Bacteroidales bacterium]